MKSVDGRSRALVVDADFLARAAAFRRNNPGYLRQTGAVVQQGEVVIVEGTDELLEADGARFAVRMPAVASKVIESFGDHFQAMTLWLTFDEAANTNAEAYEFTVRADVRGLGHSRAGQQRRLRVEGHPALAAEHEAGVAAGQR